MIQEARSEPLMQAEYTHGTNMYDAVNGFNSPLQLEIDDMLDQTCPGADAQTIKYQTTIAIT